jgi:hypothetical protein
MLPRRHKDGNTVRILLTGAWFFSDRVLTADQSRALLAVEVGLRYSTMVFLLSAVMALPSTNLHTYNGLVFFLL